MSIVGHGIDLAEVDDFLRHWGSPPSDELLARCFTRSELAAVGTGPNRVQRLAARFAAKEAVLKALGVGWAAGVAWTDVEIGALSTGAPTVALYGRAAELAAERGIVTWLLSITHTTSVAAASAVALSAGHS